MHVVHKHTHSLFPTVRYIHRDRRAVGFVGWCGHSGVVGPRIGAHSIGDDILAVTFAAVLVGLLFFFPL